jgi:hypothetical protein
MIGTVDGARVTVSTVGGADREEGTRVLFFLRSASGFEWLFSGRSNPVIHYPVFIHNRGENKQG